MNVERISAEIASAYQPPDVGRPSCIGDQEIVQTFLSAVEAGNYLDTACELADISKETYRQWTKRAEAGETPYKQLIAATKRASAIAEAQEVSKVRTAGNDPRFWAASMTYLERRHPERWARRQEGNDGPKVIVQIGVRDSDVQVSIASVSEGNHNRPYQTQTLGESESMQPLTAPYVGAIEAKVVGESE